MSVQFRVDRRLQKFLREGPGMFKDFREPLQKSGRYMQKSFSITAAAGGRPVRWPILSVNTVLARTGNIGRGRMSAAIAFKKPGSTLLRSYGIGRSRPDIWELSSHKLTLGSAHRYSEVHHYGRVNRIPEVRPKGKKALRWMVPWAATAWLGGKVKGARKDIGVFQFAKRARAHNVRIPSRPIAVIQVQDPRECAMIFQQWMMKKIGL